MVKHYCDFRNTRVVDTRVDGDKVIRARVCLTCGKSWLSIEHVAMFDDEIKIDKEQNRRTINALIRKREMTRTAFNYYDD